MKTTELISSEISSVIDKAGEKVTTSVKNKVSFLRQCIRYIETSPTQSFIDSEIKRVKHTIKVLEERFSEWTPKAPTDNPYRDYCKEVELLKLKKQLKTLLYIR